MNAIQVGAVLVSVHVWDNRLDPTLDSFVDYSIYIISDTSVHCNSAFFINFSTFLVLFDLVCFFVIIFVKAL